MGNLELVFPDKSPAERKQIAKKFYRHFSDHIIESFKLIHFSKADLNRHFTYHNIELLNNLMDQGHSLILVSGHIGNWEWMVNIQSQLRHKYLAIYKPLASKSFDRLVKHLRSKYAEDGELVTMKEIYKRLLELRKENVKSITWFLADQSPPGGYPERKKFFGVETPVYAGPAKLAKRFNYSIVYLEISKQSRGFYRASFRLLNEEPAQFSEDKLISDYISAIEDSIKKQPELWLWSHRRWKHSVLL
jgi:KDO2-lipid IV(A) lauroyltransferase